MKKIGTMLLFSFLITGCTQAQPDSKALKKEAIVISSSQVNAPSFFHLSVLKDVNWEEAPSFVDGKIPLKGIERRIAIADTPIVANEQNEIMWYFLDPEIPTGNLSIIALKQGSVTPTPILYQQETSKQTWTTSNTIDSTTNELPITISLPSSGLWVLNIYANEKYYDQFVITVE
ncbi:lipoprotein [Bacillus cereus VD131]|nr:lipoprotein [Bacillus cereus VD131]